MTWEKKTLVTSKDGSRTLSSLNSGSHSLPLFLCSCTLCSLEPSATALTAPHFTPQALLSTCPSFCQKSVSGRATFFVRHVKSGNQVQRTGFLQVTSAVTETLPWKGPCNYAPVKKKNLEKRSIFQAYREHHLPSHRQTSYSGYRLLETPEAFR